MSDLTQRLQRLMSPEAQENNSREFNVTISILTDIREDMRTVAAKVDGLSATVSGLTGDFKAAVRDVEHLKDGHRANTKKIERLEDGQRKTPSRWTGSMRPWSGKRGDGGDDSSQMATVLKYVGIALGSFTVGIGSLVAAWQQMTPQSPEKTTYVPPPAHYEKYDDAECEQDTEPPQSREEMP